MYRQVDIVVITTGNEEHSNNVKLTKRLSVRPKLNVHRHDPIIPDPTENSVDSFVGRA